MTVEFGASGPFHLHLQWTGSWSGTGPTWGHLRRQLYLLPLPQMIPDSSSIVALVAPDVHPDVREAAVVGTEAESGLVVPVAFVALTCDPVRAAEKEEGGTEASLLTHSRARIIDTVSHETRRRAS